MRRRFRPPRALGSGGGSRAPCDRRKTLIALTRTASFTALRSSSLQRSKRARVAAGTCWDGGPSSRVVMTFRTCPPVGSRNSISYSRCIYSLRLRFPPREVLFVNSCAASPCSSLQDTDVIFAMEEETWRIIAGCDGYDVSNLGRVRSLKYGKERILSQVLSVGSHASGGAGYYRVYPTQPNSKKMSLRVHREVARAFVENPENKPHVDHINRITTDNRAANLRWVTFGENGLNTKRHFTDTYGISYNKQTQFFMVEIRTETSRKYIGRRRTLEEAKQLRDSYN